MRMTGAENIAELYAAAKSSDVEIKGVSRRDWALADRAVRRFGNRMDHIAFWSGAQIPVGFGREIVGS
ncbi:hypothetical protein ACVWZK_002930 [Bradyrhizobium sp. GM0.4]